ncbi:MAG: GspE/PulE family protein [Candidatus Acidulodesulfobacterium sp.]
MKIGEYFISKRKLTEEQLKDALFIQSIGKKRLGEILTDCGYVTDADIALYAAGSSGREFFGDLNSFYIDKKENEYFGFVLLYDIPAVIAKKDGVRYIVCSEITSSLSEKMAFDEHFKSYKIAISTKRKIYEALSKIFINNKEFSEKEILNEAIEIALLKGSPNLRIKRTENFYMLIMDGEIYQENIRALSLESGQRIINIIAANCQVTLKKGEGLDAKFIFVSNFYKGLKVSVRVAFLPISSKLDKELMLFEAVLRIHGLNKVFDFESIGFTEENAELLKKSYIHPNGLIIATGPTGSGKTTTFYAMLKLLSQKKSTILTIEDPVEIELRESNITQMNISEDFGYPEAVRVMLRSEPDIMMIGEIRDEITAKHALIAAETGHLVLTTLHANSSLSIFGRFKSLNIDVFQLFSVLRFVTAQRLYNPLCPECKKKIYFEELHSIYKKALMQDVRFAGETMFEINIKSKNMEKFIDTAADFQSVEFIDTVFVRGEKTCGRCGGTGYDKRKPIIEIAEFNEAAKEEIYKDLNLLFNPSYLESVLINLSGFKSLKMQSFEKLLSGEIDPQVYFTLSR